MKIICPFLDDDGFLPKKYSCDGNGVNPPLNFVDVPSDVKSFCLVMDDPDAPGETYTHWLVWNIHPVVRGIEENSVPLGAVVGLNSAGKEGYAPPCPPSGTHRYFFKLYALDQYLALEQNISKEQLEAECKSHLIEKAVLISKYSRQ